MVLSYHLTVALVKDVNFGSGGGSGGGSSAPLPWNESASVAARELNAAMKVLDAWSGGRGVKKSAIDRLDRAVAAGWEVVDAPRRVRLVGECPSCGLDVSVEVGAEEWSCTCGAGGNPCMIGQDGIAVAQRRRQRALVFAVSKDRMPPKVLHPAALGREI